MTPEQSFRHPGEATALAFLRKERGHVLLRHNYHLPRGEIDLITVVPAQDFCLHAIEVKAWRHGRHSVPPTLSGEIHPLHSMHRRRQSLLRTIMRHFQAEAVADGPGRDAGAILNQVACPWPADQLDVSFDLVWVQSGQVVQYFEDLF